MWQVADLRNALIEEREITVVILNYSKAQTPFWNQLHLRPCRDSQHRLQYYVGVCRNHGKPAQLPRCSWTEYSILSAPLPFSTLRILPSQTTPASEHFDLKKSWLVQASSVGRDHGLHLLLLQMRRTGTLQIMSVKRCNALCKVPQLLPSDSLSPVLALVQ